MVTDVTKHDQTPPIAVGLGKGLESVGLPHVPPCEGIDGGGEKSYLPGAEIAPRSGHRLF